MAVDDSLRKTHPQKFWLKSISNILYNMGVGSCWYEDSQMSAIQKRFYPVWCVIINAYIFVVIINQFLVVTLPDLTVKEQADYRQFTIGNASLVIKIVIFYLQRDHIKVLFERFLERNREFSSLDLERASMKTSFRFCFILVSLVYLTLLLTLVECLTGYIKHGTPIQVQQTLYPTPSSPRMFFIVMRFFIDFQWYYTVSIIMGFDCICVTSLIIVAYKFKRLQTYFGELRTIFLENLEVKTRSTLEKEFEKAFIDGIKLHDDALRCARYLQFTLGRFYSFQIIQSLFIIVSCLFNMVTSQHELAVILPKMCYFVGIIVMTGCYMLAAGDITNESALVPTAIYDCGWELNRPRRRLRTLVVMALMSSHRPVKITAFGVISLSYTNFVMILRHSYSFFAVMYK